jgi:hypothetical protein
MNDSEGGIQSPENNRLAYGADRDTSMTKLIRFRNSWNGIEGADTAARVLRTQRRDQT